MVFSMLRTTKPIMPAAIIAAALLLCNDTAGTGNPTAAEPAPNALFQSLAGKVAQADRLERFDFATIALNELITAYEASYRESSHEQHDKLKAQQKLARWRRESKSFIDQLSAQLAAVSYTSRIEIATQQSGPLILFIDDSPIVISGPEIGKAGQMEQRIIERFCTLHDCTGYRDTALAPLITEVPRVPAGWQLQYRQGATYVTGDGLSFVFGSLDNRTEKQARCEAVARDLRMLVAGIQNAQRAGYTVDFKRLTIATLHDGTTEHIVINEAGEYLNMDLGFFGNGRKLEQPFLGWVERRVAGRSASLVIRDAEQRLR